MSDTATILRQNGPETAFGDANSSISPEWVLENTVTSDITDDFCLMERARWMTAEGYANLANPERGLTVENVYSLVCEDVYERNGQARTIAALTTNPETGCTEIAGCVRIVFGTAPFDEQQQSEVAIEAINFMLPLRGWPHECIPQKLVHVAELGRFSIASKWRSLPMRQAGIHVLIAKLLYQELSALVESSHVDMLYAIMPSYMARLTVQAGARLERLESRLRLEVPEIAHIAEEFSLYWRNASPGLYQVYL